MEVDEPPKLPDPIVAKSVEFRAYRPSTYSVKAQIVLDHLIEAVVSTCGRLVFLRPSEQIKYQVVDLGCGTVKEFKISGDEFDHFDEFRLLPLKNSPHTAAILSRQHLRNNVWIYKIARFHMNVTDFCFKRTTSWNKVLESFTSSGSCFIDTEAVYFLYESGRNQLAFRRYDFQSQHLDKNVYSFEDDMTTAAWNTCEFKFRTFYKGEILGFIRFSERTDRTQNLTELYNNFSQITKRRIQDGKIKRKIFLNTLKCLEINDEVHDEDTYFYIDGQWIKQHFHLHIQVRSAASNQYPSNYFALLDVDKLLWQPIQMHMPTGRLDFPMQMLTIENENEQGLVFLRAPIPIDQEDSKHNKTRQRYELYRIPIRTPITLMSMCSIKTDDYYRKNRYLMDGLSSFLFQPMNC